MIIYSDLFAGDGHEFFSDAFKIKQDANTITVRCKYEMESGDLQVDTGANPSQEEQDDQLEEAAIKRNVAIVLKHELQEVTSFYTKKSYFKYLKGYVKKLQAKIEADGGSEDDVKAFREAAVKFVKDIGDHYDDIQLFIPKEDDMGDPQAFIAPIRRLPEADESGNEYEAIFLKRGLVGTKF